MYKQCYIERIRRSILFRYIYKQLYVLIFQKFISKQETKTYNEL